tara:strand:+ start:1571 stop:1924 length:354 start_codon:yes stop_codon:yes gene_type:complete
MLYRQRMGDWQIRLERQVNFMTETEQTIKIIEAVSGFSTINVISLSMAGVAILLTLYQLLYKPNSLKATVSQITSEEKILRCRQEDDVPYFAEILQKLCKFMLREDYGFFRKDSLVK